MGRREDGDDVMEETVQQVGQVYLGRHLADRDITDRHVNGVTWQWREYDLGDGLKLETLRHPNSGAGNPFPGHCLVRRDGDLSQQAVCHDRGDYNWGEEVVRFFTQQPCAAAAPPPAPPTPTPSGGCSYEQLIAEQLPAMQAICCRNGHCRANGKLKQCSDRCAQAIGELKRSCAGALTGTANGRAVDGLLTQSVADGGCHGHGSGQPTGGGAGH